MQRLVRKLGLPAIIAVYAAAFCGLAASMIVALGYHDQLSELKALLYARCQTRSVSYDAPNHRALGADLAWKRSLLRLTMGNAALTRQVIVALPPKVRAPLRAEQAAELTNLRRAVTGAAEAYRHGVIGQCGAYK